MQKYPRRFCVHRRAVRHWGQGGGGRLAWFLRGHLSVEKTPPTSAGFGGMALAALRHARSLALHH
jgi:hypothetical protein